MKRKTQTSIEFIILLSFLLFFFVLFFLAIQQNSSARIREQQDIILKEVALTVKNEIDLASASGEGYFRQFTIPRQIGNKDYQIQIVADFLYLKTIDNEQAIALPIPLTIGQPVIGNNVIQNKAGLVRINI